MKKLQLLVVMLGLVNVGWSQSGASESPAAAGVSLPVSGWSVVGAKDTKFGPREEGGKIIFSGEGFGLKGKSLAAYFPKTELGVGQTLKFKGTVRFTGVAGTGNFRFGVFQKYSKDHARKWLGYCAYTGLDKAFPKGNLLARLSGNEGDFSGMKGMKGEETARSLGESAIGIKTVKDGSYEMVMELKRDATVIEVTASMDGSADLPTPMAKYSAKDEKPETTSFDAIGFNSHEVLSADSIEFSDVSVNLAGP